MTKQISGLTDGISHILNKKDRSKAQLHKKNYLETNVVIECDCLVST